MIHDSIKKCMILVNLIFDTVHHIEDAEMHE